MVASEHVRKILRRWESGRLSMFELDSDTLGLVRSEADYLENYIRELEERCAEHSTPNEPRARIHVAIEPDGRCACSCADECPLGKTGMGERCTADELVKAGCTVSPSTPIADKLHKAAIKNRERLNRFADDVCLADDKGELIIDVDDIKTIVSSVMWCVQSIGTRGVPKWSQKLYGLADRLNIEPANIL